MTYSERIEIVMNSNNWWMLVLMAFLPFISLALYLRSPKQRLKKLSAEEVESYKRGYEQELEQEDEYTTLLTSFGLDDTASENQIKAAYRQKMKELHPDTGAAQSEEVAQQFRELKKNYDRIIELKKRMFG